MQTDRDRELVEWIGRLGAAGTEHVKARFRMGRSQAYARLADLSAAQLLTGRRLLYGQPALYVASRRGLRWCGLSRLGFCRLNVATFAQARELVDVAVELHALLAGWRVMSERELRVEETHAGEPLGSFASASSPTGGQPFTVPTCCSSHLRDGASRSSSSCRSRRAGGCLRSAAATRARHLERVYYLAAPAPARAVQRAVRELRATERVGVLPLANVGELTALEREDPLAADV